jgi:3-phosphoshikimate 1-carboxyvinyltransferase
MITVIETEAGVTETMGLCGRFRPPGDKSVSHRVALFSLLAEGRCQVSGYSTCADCASTLAAVHALGGGVEHSDDTVELTGAAGRLVPQADIDCGNSGTTMRLLSGILAGRPGRYTLDGDASLRRRPMERVAEPLRRMGADVRTQDGRPPIEIHGGNLHGAEIVLPVASAQLKSAVLLAGLQADCETWVLEPAPSRDHTERMLRAWGVPVTSIPGGLAVAPGTLTLPESFVVPGDVSGAAFFVCGAVIAPGSHVTAESVLLNPSRTGWLNVLERMGAGLTVSLAAETPEPLGNIDAQSCPALRGVDVPAKDIPNIVDEIPILALVATQAHGKTVFRNAGELRVKESDRLSAMVNELGKLGADIRVQGDDLIVDGPVDLKTPDCELESYGDHRVAMSLRIASLLVPGNVSIAEEDCAAVSYPTFADTFKQLTTACT